MSRVFVLQNQHTLSSDRGRLVPKFDISSAAHYGEMIYLLSPSANPFNPDPIVSELREKLATFSDEDYLLLIGNPAIIGWATAICADFNDGVVTLLQWNGIEKHYRPIRAELFPEVQ